MTTEKVVALDSIGLAAPARRALAGAGYTQLADLRRVSEREVAELHGIGPNALRRLREALAAHGWSFADAQE